MRADLRGNLLPLARELRAGETTDGKAVTTATEETPEYKNWIELGIGGVITSGDQRTVRATTLAAR